MTDMDLLQLFSESAQTGEGESENTGNPEENSAVQPRASLEAGSDEEFEELISGKYREAFRKRTQGIIDRRFARAKSDENTLRVCAPLFESLSRDFPDVAPDDTEGLVNAYLKKAQAAEREKAHGELLSKAEKQLKLRAAREMRDRLLSESARLKEIYPSFDLKGEISSSPDFERLLSAGIPLRRAYECVNLERIMGSALRYAVARTAGKTAEAVRSGGRIQENSLADRASSVKRTDVKNLSEKDIMRILSEVGRGAKITF